MLKWPTAKVVSFIVLGRKSCLKKIPVMMHHETPIDRFNNSILGIQKVKGSVSNKFQKKNVKYNPKYYPSCKL